jgi:hypothetical protein
LVIAHLLHPFYHHASTLVNKAPLRRLLDLKDQTHYGLFDVSGNNLMTALRQAEGLISFAADALQR